MFVLLNTFSLCYNWIIFVGVNQYEWCKKEISERFYPTLDRQGLWKGRKSKILDRPIAERLRRAWCDGIHHLWRTGKLDHTSFIDGYISATHVMIEQKSVDKDLRKAIKQSDGTYLSPFQQAKCYASELPYSKCPHWIVICNFADFLKRVAERILPTSIFGWYEQ